MNALTWSWHQLATMTPRQGLALGLVLIAFAFVIFAKVPARDDERSK